MAVLQQRLASHSTYNSINSHFRDERPDENGPCNKTFAIT